jgi:hypothetical protein
MNLTIAIITAITSALVSFVVAVISYIATMHKIKIEEKNLRKKCKGGLLRGFMNYD